MSAPLLRVLFCALSLLGALGSVPAAHAAPSGPLVMVNAPASDVLLAQAALRTSAELHAAGFRVQRGDCLAAQDVTCGRPGPPGALSVAAVGLRRSGEGVVIDVHLVRAGAQDSIALQRELRPTRAGGLQPGVIAVCAAELVHASLTPSAGQFSREPVTTRPFVDVGPIGMVSVAPAYGVGVRAGVVRGGTWALSLHAMAATSTILEETGVSEIISQVAVSRRWRSGARLQPQLSMGAGAHHLSSSDEVRVVRAWTPFLALGAGLAFNLNDTWTLRAELQTLILTDALQIEIARSSSPPSAEYASSWPVLPVLSLAIEAAR